MKFFHKQGIKGTHAEIENACEPYGFHPLSLRLLAGALKQDPRYHADIRNAPSAEMRDADKESRMARMLAFAYDSLPPQEQKLLSQLSAFRSPMKYETIQDIFFTTEDTGNTEKKQEIKTSVTSVRSVVDFGFSSKRDLAHAISNLSERGLYMRDVATDTFDLHPVIRRYCYDRLVDKQQTHTIFIVYFAKIETPQKIQTLADLQPTIELYHHTVRAGRYDEARTLFRDRLNRATYYQLGAYQLRIELLRALFPDGEDKPPRLKTEDHQGWTFNELANSYSLSGQPHRAVPLFEQDIVICEKLGNKKNLAIDLGNVAQDQIRLGELKAAEQNLRRRIEISREIKDEFNEAVGHQEFGRVLAYRGQFAEAEHELNLSFEYDKNKNDVQGQSVDFAYRALLALLMGDASAALGAARKAREFAEEDARTRYPHEADFIRAEWMIGAALTLTLTLSRSQNPRTGEGKLPLPSTGEGRGEGAEAEHHLQEPLARDRKIGLVELEAAILLEFARLRLAQAKMTEDGGQRTEKSSVVGHPSSVALMDESLERATEALENAERCEYRLQEAEIQNFLSEWWLAEADRRRRTEDGEKLSVVGHRSSVSDALAQAKEHATRAKERAWCDGPPYHYKVAYEQAERLLKSLEALQ